MRLKHIKQQKSYTAPIILLVYQVLTSVVGKLGEIKERKELNTLHACTYTHLRLFPALLSPPPVSESSFQSIRPFGEERDQLKIHFRPFILQNDLWYECTFLILFFPKQSVSVLHNFPNPQKCFIFSLFSIFKLFRRSTHNPLE